MLTFAFYTAGIMLFFAGAAVIAEIIDLFIW